MSDPIITKEIEYTGRREVEKRFTYEDLLDIFDENDGTVVFPLVKRCQKYEEEIKKLKEENYQLKRELDVYYFDSCMFDRGKY